MPWICARTGQLMKDPIRVTTATRVWSNLRRRLGRNEWAIRLLGLQRSTESPLAPGLILLQIDGLSQTRLQQAIRERRMPFLASLLEREKYVNHVLYSGLPASTPAGQVELYYGQPAGGPACEFLDQQTGQLVRVSEPGGAGQRESQWAGGGTGLLEGGSSWCNHWGGGAADVHFCATSSGWSGFFRRVNPFRLLMVMLLNGAMFVRVAGIAVAEFFRVLAAWFRGLPGGRGLWQELRMIPARVVVVGLLRELATMGASIDAARGVPRIHVNFLGYDELADRWGPQSTVARRTLRRIDRCIRRIWMSAHRGPGPDYDVWVFSGHGQQATRPGQREPGRWIQNDVDAVVESVCPRAAAQATARSTAPSVTGRPGRRPSRANWLGIGWLEPLWCGEPAPDLSAHSSRVRTITSGSLGLVYLIDEPVGQHRDEIARRLVSDLPWPLVVVPEGHAARVFTASGVYRLPGDAVPVFGAAHPFLEELSADLIRLAGHPDAGDIVLVGWYPDRPGSGLAVQPGAHSGPGLEETGAFALLPPDTPLPESNRRYLRVDDLRQAALNLTGPTDCRVRRPSPPAPSGPERFRLLTYNVHACVGMDGELSTDRIARVIGQSAADIVCLQELDAYRARSGKHHQAQEIAKRLAMEYQFHPAWNVEEEQFGNAVLSRFPLRVIRATGLHHHKADRSRRSALWVEVDLPQGTRLQVINTHLSIYPGEQRTQARQLLEEWVGPALQSGPVVLCGDFNARPGSTTWQILDRELEDAESIRLAPHRSTYFSPFPLSRLDHVFLGGSLQSREVEVIATRLARTASDHLPVVVELNVGSSHPDPPESGSGDECGQQDPAT